MQASTSQTQDTPTPKQTPPMLPKSPLPAVAEFITSSGQATVELATHASKFVSHHVEAFRHTLGTAALTLFAAVVGSAVVVPGALLSRSVGDDIHREWLVANRTTQIAFDFRGWNGVMPWYKPGLLGFQVWYAAVSEVYIAYNCLALYSMYGWRRVGFGLAVFACCVIFMQGFLIVLLNSLFVYGKETEADWVVLVSFVFGTGGILSQFYVTQRAVPERNLTRIGIISSISMAVALYFYYTFVFNLYYSQSLVVAVVIRVVVHTAIKNILLGITVNLFTRLRLANERALHLMPGGVVIFMAMAGRFMQILSTNLLLVIVTEILQIFVEVAETYTMMNMGRNPVNQTLKRATTHVWTRVKPQGFSFRFFRALFPHDDEPHELSAAVEINDRHPPLPVDDRAHASVDEEQPLPQIDAQKQNNTATPLLKPQSSATRVANTPANFTNSLDLSSDHPVLLQSLEGTRDSPKQTLSPKETTSPKQTRTPKQSTMTVPSPIAGMATQTLAARSLGAMNNGLTFQRHVPPRVERLKTLYANLITCTAIAEGSASLVAMTFVLLANVNPGSSNGSAIDRQTVLTNVAIVFFCETFLSDFVVAYVNARLCVKKGFTDLARTFKHRRRELDFVFIFGCAFLGGSVASFFVLSLCVVENKSGHGTVFNRCT